MTDGAPLGSAAQRAAEQQALAEVEQHERGRAA